MTKKDVYPFLHTLIVYTYNDKERLGYLCEVSSDYFRCSHEVINGSNFTFVYKTLDYVYKYELLSEIRFATPDEINVFGEKMINTLKTSYDVAQAKLDCLNRKRDFFNKAKELYESCEFFNPSLAYPIMNATCKYLNISMQPNNISESAQLMINTLVVINLTNKKSTFAYLEHVNSTNIEVSYVYDNQTKKFIYNDCLLIIDEIESIRPAYPSEIDEFVYALQTNVYNKLEEKKPILEKANNIKEFTTKVSELCKEYSIDEKVSTSIEATIDNFYF